MKCISCVFKQHKLKPPVMNCFVVTAHDHPDGSTGKYRPAFLDHFERKDQNEQNSKQSNGTPPQAPVVSQSNPQPAPAQPPQFNNAGQLPIIGNPFPPSNPLPQAAAAALGGFPFPRGLETIDMNFVRIVYFSTVGYHTLHWPYKDTFYQYF